MGRLDRWLLRVGVLALGVLLLTGGGAGNDSSGLVGGLYNASNRTIVDGHKAALEIDSTGRLEVNVTASGAIDTELPAAAALADDEAAATAVPSVGARAMVFDGATWDRARGDSANGTDVDVTRIGGQAPSFGAGVTGATVLRVDVATDAVVSVDDNAGSLTVDNAALAVVGGGVEATALRVTLASDGTGLVSVDDNGGNLSIDLAGTAASLNTGVVDAGTQRVTLATDVALPTGANTVGSIASVTTSVTPGTAAANLGKAEDAVHTSADVGVMALGVANTDGTDLAAAGDYVPAARTVDGVAKTVEQVGVMVTETGEVLTVSRQRGVTNLTTGSEVTIRAAQGAGVEVIVVGWVISVDTAATLRFESDLSGVETAIGPDVYLAANGGWTSDYTYLWFEAGSNEALELENGGASTINVGWTVYTVQR